MVEKINAADAMLKVLEDWGVKNIYGLPGGSFDSTMNALHNRRNTLHFVQVRHEEVGALAASGEAKVTGKLGVTFGSAGPGAVHLLNGLYDAKYDHVPVLALVGQVPTATMNTDYFQEMNENPMFADVAVYNRTATTAAGLPHVVDEAIRQAYKHNGVAVVTIPKDLGWTEIDDNFVSTAAAATTSDTVAPATEKIDAAIALLKAAEKPLIYIGQGARGATNDIITLSEKLSAPIVSTVPAKGIVPDDYKAYMGSAGRVASKPGVETSRAADTVLFVGTDFPFTAYFFAPDVKFIQVDTDSAKLGKRHAVEVSILADAVKTFRALVERSGDAVPEKPFYKAALANKVNWRKWIDSFEESDQTPMRVEPVFKQINDMAEPDAIFQVDVGNVTIDGMRFLRMNHQEQFTTSAWYATMGYGIPAAIAAKEAFPNRQVFSISGDGGWTMVVQDLLTQVKEHLPIINVVLSNQSLGFIEAEQDDTKQPHSGVDLLDADWAGVAEDMGATGYKVTNLAELKMAFEQAKTATGPVVIDVKIANERPLPVEQLVLDPETQDPAAVKAFVEEYQAQGLIPLRQLLADAEK